MKRKMKVHHKIFIGLFLGVIVGYILNLLGGVENAFINDTVLPFFQFLGDLFIRLIRMIVVPLVFFSIIDAVVSLGDPKKLKGIGIKTIIFFLAGGMIAVSIGLVLANIVQPGAGFNMPGEIGQVEIKELPGMYETILNLIPNNPFESLTSGEMMQVITFSILTGIALLMVGKESESIRRAVGVMSQAMFKIIEIILHIIPLGVFGLMSVAITRFGLAIFGPVLKFIIVDYVACLLMIFGVYSVILKVFAKVSVRQFWRYGFESFLIAFSTCTSAAALPVAMKNSRRMGIPKQVGNFVLPLGATANMNGTCIYFGIIVIFASQLYGIPLSFGQQVMLAVTATLLSVGAAATPQIGLVISITLLTSMGLPLEATALVAGVYRIIDQIHTGTNSVGDLVFATAVAEMEGVLDHELYNNIDSKPDDLDDDNLLELEVELADE